MSSSSSCSSLSSSSSCAEAPADEEEARAVFDAKHKPGPSADASPPAMFMPPWLPGAMQLASSASVTCILKFNMVVWHASGFRGLQLALLSTSSCAGLFLGSNFWGVLADVLGGVKHVLLVSHLGSTLAVLSLLFPAVRGSLFTLVLINSALTFLLSGDFGVIDTLCLAAAEENGAGAGEYGSMRCWNSLGCGVMSCVLGLVIPAAGVDVTFIAYTVWQLPMLLLLLLVPNVRVNRAEFEVEALLGLLRSHESLFFFANLLVYGLIFALIEVYSALYYMDVLHASTAMIGASVLIMCLTEAALFPYIDGVLKQFKFKWAQVYTLCHVSLAVRYVALSLVPEEVPWLALVSEVLHGVNFAVMWFATVQQADELAPEGARATLQSLASSTYFFLSFSLGSVLWGLALTRPPPSGLGLRRACVLAAAAVLLWSLAWNGLLHFWAAHARAAQAAARLLLHSPMGK